MACKTSPHDWQCLADFLQDEPIVVFNECVQQFFVGNGQLYIGLMDRGLTTADDPRFTMARCDLLRSFQQFRWVCSNPSFVLIKCTTR